MDSTTVRAIRLYYDDMSREDFAKKVGCSYSTISMIETGHRRVTENMKFKIIKAFELTDELMKLIERYRQINGLV